MAIANKLGQRGAALLTSLLILLILSLLAVASVQNVSLQERMVSAGRDAQVALEAAEAAAREAERRLENNTVTLGDFGVADGLYNKTDAPDMFDSETWASTETKSIAATNPGGLPTAPRYFIEHIGPVTTEEAINDLAVGNYTGASSSAPPEGFRIVAWSSGQTGQAFRVIEVYYGKRS